MDRYTHGQALVLDADAALARFASSVPDAPPLRQSGRYGALEYRGYRELLQAWADLPNTRSRMIGRSVRGQPLWVCEIGNPAAQRVSVVLAGLHPIEWIGVETALALAELHSQRPDADRRICFFPLVNVDGFQRVEADLRAHRRRWLRSNENGVDLNRNWPTHFRRRKGLIAGYKRSGPAPRSEPEVAAVCDTLDEIARTARVDLALSLHSIGKMILYPFGGRWAAPADRGRQAHIAAALERRLPGYRARQCSHWVPGAFAHGMEIDHLHRAYGATALLIECSRGDLTWKSPGALFDPFRLFNPRAARATARHIATAADAFVRGRL